MRGSSALWGGRVTGELRGGCGLLGLGARIDKLAICKKIEVFSRFWMPLFEGL